MQDKMHIHRLYPLYELICYLLIFDAVYLVKKIITCLTQLVKFYQKDTIVFEFQFGKGGCQFKRLFSELKQVPQE